MKRWTVLLMSLAAVFCLASCGAGSQETAQEKEEPPAETTTEPKQEEPKEKPQEESKPEPQEKPKEEPQEEPEEKPEDDYMELYEKVLDMFRSNVNNGFSAQMGDGVDPYDPGNVSDFFYMEARYNGSLSLSDVGYTLMDLNGDNTPELIVSLMKDQGYYCGLIADLYTIKNGEVVHVLSSSDRNRYDLATDHSINFHGHGGYNYGQEFNFRLKEDVVTLNFGESLDGTQYYSHPKDSVIHSIKLSAESNPISEYYDPNSYYDYTGETNRQEISESEAETLRAQMPAAQSLDLTPLG